MAPAPRTRDLARRHPGRWVRAGACATSVWLQALPSVAQVNDVPPTPEVLPSAPAPSSPSRPSPRTLGSDSTPGERPFVPGTDPTWPREPRPTGLELPDRATVDEMKGQYGLGLGLLILGGILTVGALIALFTLLARKSWSEQT